MVTLSHTPSHSRNRRKIIDIDNVRVNLSYDDRIIIGKRLQALIK